MTAPDVRAHLPVHPSQATGVEPGRLRIDGLVEHSLDLTPAELAGLPQQTYRADFACEEGWVVPGLVWQGVSLAEVLDRAGISAPSRWVRVSAGDFGISLPLERAGAALLALRLDDQPVPPEHGGPVRLIVPDGQCFSAVKWVDHLEVQAEPGPQTARDIALARIQPPASA